eukprot:6492213-Amphidinium_carterae.2
MFFLLHSSIARNLKDQANARVSVSKAIVADQSRKGAGGAWRAFVHERCRGMQLTRDLVQGLSKEYKALSTASREHYAGLGLLATAAAKHGGVSFPAYSHTAEVSRGIAPTLHKTRKGCDAISDAIAKEVKALRSANMSLQVDAKGKEQAVIAFCKQQTEQHLVRRHQLESGTANWIAIPHTCSNLHSYGHVASSKVEELQSEASISELHSTWSCRHEGVRHTDANGLAEVPAEKQRLQKTRERLKNCWLNNYCLCSAEGRHVNRMWSVIASALKLLLHTYQDDLSYGYIILEWRVASTGVRQEESEGSVEPRVIYTHVPLHYKRPWRPTFMHITLHSSFLRKGTEIMVFKPKLVEETLHFQTAIEFIRNLYDAHRMASIVVQALRLSTDVVPCDSPRGHVYASRLKDIWQVVWEPNMRLKRKEPVHKQLEALLTSPKASATKKQKRAADYRDGEAEESPVELMSDAESDVGSSLQQDEATKVIPTKASN